MSLSLSLLLPGRYLDTGEYIAPFTRRRRYYALKNTDGTSPVLNPFYNPYGNDELDFGQVEATWSADRNRLQGMFTSCTLYSPNGQTSISVNQGGTTVVRNDSTLLSAYLGTNNIPLSKGSSVPTTGLSASDKTFVESAELVAIIQSLPPLFYNPSVPDWALVDRPSQSFNNRTSLESGEYTNEFIQNLMIDGQSYNIFLGGQSFLRPENQIPSEFSLTMPADPNNRGIVEIDVNFARNHDNSPGYGPAANRTTDTDTYYITGMSLVRDHGPQRSPFRFDSDRVTFDSVMHTFDEDV